MKLQKYLIFLFGITLDANFLDSTNPLNVQMIWIMKKILLTKKLHINFFLHNLHTVREGIIEIFGKIKEYGFTSFSSLSFHQSKVITWVPYYVTNPEYCYYKLLLLTV